MRVARGGAAAFSCAACDMAGVVRPRVFVRRARLYDSHTRGRFVEQIHETDETSATERDGPVWKSRVTRKYRSVFGELCRGVWIEMT